MLERTKLPPVTPTAVAGSAVWVASGSDMPLCQRIGGTITIIS
jgi:hypothetical protein